MGKRRIVIIVLLFISLFTGCCRKEESTDEPLEDEKLQAKLYTFFVTCLSEVRLEGKQAEDFYITNTGNLWGLYYINDENQLYGYRKGIDVQYIRQKSNDEYPDMQLIAEDVIHVDCGGQRNYTIFLTTDGKMYGMGYTSSGVLLSEEDTCFESPVLLMDEVKYALCGEGDIVVLKYDGSVWTWGTMIDEEGVEYAEKEPVPVKLLENAIMISGKTDSHAALLEDGTVWTWGNNAYGQCGVAGERVVGEPICVAYDAVSIWMGKIQMNALCTDWEKWCHYGYDGGFRDNLVIKKEDGSLWACGKNIESTESSKVRDGIVYTHIFMPCRIEQTPYIIYDGLNTYQSVLEEYERIQKDESYTPEQWKKVDYTFSFYKQKYELYYSLKDLTDDGTEELVLAFLDEGEYIVKAIYAYDEGIIITVDDYMEGIEHKLYEQGIIKSVQYGGGGRVYYTFTQLQKKSGLTEWLVEVYGIPKNWGGGEEEGMRYYRRAGISLDEEEEITEDEFMNIMDRYEAAPVELEWHLVEGFWNPEGEALQ